jgi:ABC-type multidrug transport system fused ATPase/permease subunit
MFLPNFSIIIINICICVIGAIYFDWRTGLTALSLIPLILIAQSFQFKFLSGYADFKGKAYDESNSIVGEAVTNIRTVLTLGGRDYINEQYATKLDDIFNGVIKKCILSGFMLGISYLLQYLTVALMLFLAAVYIDTYNLDLEGPMTSIFLIFFACVSAGNKTNLIQDLATIDQGVKNMLDFLDS